MPSTETMAILKDKEGRFHFHVHASRENVRRLGICYVQPPQKPPITRRICHDMAKMLETVVLHSTATRRPRKGVRKETSDFRNRSGLSNILGSCQDNIRIALSKTHLERDILESKGAGWSVSCRHRRDVKVGEL